MPKVIAGVKMFTQDEIAAELGVTSDNVASLRNSGALPAKRIGKPFYTSETQLQEYLKNHSTNQSK